VDASREDSDDGEDVLCDALSGICVLRIHGHDAGPELFEQPLNEVEAEPCEAVFVGDHNRFDSTRHASVQKGLQAGAFEVETGTDVEELFDWGVGPAGTCFGSESLRFPVPELLAGGDSGVQSDDPGTCGCRFGGRHFDSPVPSICQRVPYPAAGSPVADGALTDSESAPLLCWC
jgi:hypothetical protein